MNLCFIKKYIFPNRKMQTIKLLLGIYPDVKSGLHLKIGLISTLRRDLPLRHSGGISPRFHKCNSKLYVYGITKKFYRQIKGVDKS